MRGEGKADRGLAAGLALLAAAPAAADVREWDAGDETSSWEEDANWTGDVMPGAGDVARIVVVESGEWPQIVSDVTVARLEHMGYGLDILDGTLTVTDGARLAGEQLWVQEGGRLRLGGESTWERGALSVGGGVVGVPRGTLEVPAGATLRASGTDSLSGAQGGRFVLGGTFEAVGGEPLIGTPVELGGSIRATGGRLWL